MRQHRLRRQSMEQLDLIKLTPDGKKITHSASVDGEAVKHKENYGQVKKPNEDDFFDLLTRTQSKRMDDQRCSLKVGGIKPLAQQNQNIKKMENR